MMCCHTICIVYNMYDTCWLRIEPQLWAVKIVQMRMHREYHLWEYCLLSELIPLHFDIECVCHWQVDNSVREVSARALVVTVAVLVAIATHLTRPLSSAPIVWTWKTPQSQPSPTHQPLTTRHPSSPQSPKTPKMLNGATRH